MLEIHDNVDEAYNDLNDKFENLSTHMKTLESQVAQDSSYSKRHVGPLTRYPKQTRKSISKLLIEKR